MRFVLRTGDLARARLLAPLLEAAGKPVRLVVDAASAVPFQEDVSLIDWAMGEARAVSTARALAAAAAPPLAIVALFPEADAAALAAARESAAFDACLAHDWRATLLARALESVARDGQAKAEAAARALTAAALGHVVDTPEPQHAPPRILFVGAPDPCFLALDHRLRVRGGAARASFTSFAAFDHLHDEAFDAVALNARSDASAALSLCGALRRNTDLNQLPTLFLHDGQDALAEEATSRGASVLVAPGDDVEARLAWLDADIARRRSRIAVEAALSARLLEAAAPGLAIYSRAAFLAHLETLARTHEATDRPLSVATLHFSPAPGATPPEPRQWQAGFREAASLAARLLRACDAPALIDGETLVVIFPCTEREEAAQAAERLASVTECTAFAFGVDDGRPPIVIAASTASRAPGETGASLAARAIAALAPKSAIA